MELEKIYNMILNKKCKECNLKTECNLLESNGLDNICNNTLEIIAKEIEK